MIYDSKIADRCARILLEYATETDSLEEIYQNVQLLAPYFHDSSGLAKILGNPAITRVDKMNVLERLFKEQIHSALWRFIVVILHQGQINQFEHIVSYFVTLYKEHMGIKDAAITTAIDLPKSFINEFKGELKKRLGCKKLVLKQQTDPTIIGGYILDITPFTLDKSVRAQLSRLKDIFSNR